VRLELPENFGFGRAVLAYPTGGPFTISVAPAPLKLAACPG
jgi:hypothetical protein